MQPFHELFSEALEKKELGVTEFARLVGSSQPTISSYKNGWGKAPLSHRLDEWCKFLKLSNDQLEELKLAADRARCSPRLEQYIHSLERQLQRKKARTSRKGRKRRNQNKRQSYSRAAVQKRKAGADDPNSPV